MTELGKTIKDILVSTKREGMEELLIAMDAWGFFEAPCSGGYHLCEKGGLASHSWNVFTYAHSIAQAVLTDAEYEERKDNITIAALLHDLGKCGDFGKPLYIPNLLKSGKPSANKPFKQNKDLVPTPHSIRSVKLASEFIQLTEDEEWAILMHDGLYGDLKYVIQGKETPLYCLIHYADFWVSHFVEKTGADTTEDE